MIMCPTLIVHLTARDGGNAKGLFGIIFAPVHNPSGSLRLSNVATDGLMSRSAWMRGIDHMALKKKKLQTNRSAIKQKSPSAKRHLGFLN